MPTKDLWGTFLETQTATPMLSPENFYTDWLQMPLIFVAITLGSLFLASSRSAVAALLSLLSIVLLLGSGLIEHLWAIKLNTDETNIANGVMVLSSFIIMFCTNRLPDASGSDAEHFDFGYLIFPVLFLFYYAISGLGSFAASYAELLEENRFTGVVLTLVVLQTAIYTFKYLIFNMDAEDPVKYNTKGGLFTGLIMVVAVNLVIDAFVSVSLGVTGYFQSNVFDPFEGYVYENVIVPTFGMLVI